MPTIINADGSSGGSSASAWTLLRVRNLVRARLGEPLENFWGDDELDYNINAAYQQFIHEDRWSWLLVLNSGNILSAGSSQFSLTQTVAFSRQFNVRLTEIGTTNSWMATRVPSTKGHELETRYISSGFPQWFYLETSKDVTTVRFVPVASVDVTVDYTYYQEPAELVNDSDSFSVPAQYMEAIVDWATGLSWLKELQGGQKAQEQFNLYNATLDRARKDEEDQADDNPLIMGGAEPQYFPTSLSEWARLRMPTQLGP